MGFLVEWYCPVHGVIERHPDDGRDTHDAWGRLIKPTPQHGLCPWPLDEETGKWTYGAQCTRTLRRRLQLDFKVPRLFEKRPVSRRAPSGRGA